MQGDSGVILGQLLDELKKKATPKFNEAAKKRVEALTAERKAWREQAAKMATNKGKEGEINPHYLFAELNKLLKPDDIVCNEGVRNAGAVLLQLERPTPNTCVRSGGGGLGWSGGMALGAKLAAPDKMVVQVVGDGGFYFGGPCSVFAVAKQYKLPILVLLLDNTGWSAVKESTLAGVPGGRPPRRPTSSRPSLMPDAEFSKIGEAFGAYGEKVTNPDEVPAALARARQGGARRPRRDPARAGDEAVRRATSATRHSRHAPGLSRRIHALLRCQESVDARHKAGHDGEREDAMSKLCLLACGRGCALATSPSPAHAAPYPTRTVEIIVAYGAGGSTDFVARAVAQKLTGTARPALRRAQPPGRQRHHRHQGRDARPSPTATRSTSATPPRPWWCRRSPRPRPIR